VKGRIYHLSLVHVFSQEGIAFVEDEPGKAAEGRLAEERGLPDLLPDLVNPGQSIELAGFLQRTALPRPTVQLAVGRQQDFYLR
jgi:hypothetical protein